MKHRITLVTFDTQDDSSFAWDGKSKSLKLKSLKAAREDKLSFAYNELPSTLTAVLSHFKELRIRWDFGVSIGHWSMRDPFASRLPQGLHVHAKPSDGNAQSPLCDLLHEIIGDGVRCYGNQPWFTGTPESSYFFDPIQSHQRFLRYLADSLCHVYSDRCKAKLLEIDHASYVDLDYDSNSKSVDLRVFWTQAPPPPKVSQAAESERVWDEDIDAHEHFEKLEVGLFERAPDTEDYSVSLGGHYAIIGKSEHLAPMLFSFPSRHHSLPFSSSFNCSFNNPPGLHPKMKCRIHASHRPHEQCTLHSFFAVPQPFFVDPYQLADDSVVHSLGMENVQEINGETDLEAPEWTATKWGATVLARVKIDADATTTWKNDTGFDMEMPLHLRYAEPKKGESYSEALMPWPVVFWACDGTGSFEYDAKNPFRRHSHGYDDLFPAETVFYHFRARYPSSFGLQSDVQVPILDLDDAAMIGTWTMRVVVGGFFILLTQIMVGGLFRSSKNTAEAKAKKDK